MPKEPHTFSHEQSISFRIFSKYLSPLHRQSILYVFTEVYLFIEISQLKAVISNAVPYNCLCKEGFSTDFGKRVSFQYICILDLGFISRNSQFSPLQNRSIYKFSRNRSANSLSIKGNTCPGYSRKFG